MLFNVAPGLYAAVAGKSNSCNPTSRHPPAFHVLGPPPCEKKKPCSGSSCCTVRVFLIAYAPFGSRLSWLRNSAVDPIALRPHLSVSLPFSSGETFGCTGAKTGAGRAPPYNILTKSRRIVYRPRFLCAPGRQGSPPERFKRLGVGERAVYVGKVSHRPQIYDRGLGIGLP